MMDKSKELTYIAKYENYINEVTSLFKKININEIIPHRNRNPIYDTHPDLNQEKYYNSFYTKEWMKDWIREKYKDDFKIFNYGLDT